jgi:hypothetical protein
MTKCTPTKPDPIFAALAAHRKLSAKSLRLYVELDKAELAAWEEHGKRPWSLIAWRNYSAIGGSEIKDRRDEFLLQPGSDTEQVLREYRDAKARERDAYRAGREWDKRTGLTPFRRSFEQAQRAEWAALERIVNTKPTTPAGASALVTCIRKDMKQGDHP